MLDYLDKLFPAIFERLRRLPIAIKIALLLILALSPLAAAHIPDGIAVGRAFLGHEFTLSGLSIAIGILVCVLLVLLIYYVVSLLRDRSRLATFSREWTLYSSHYFLLYTHIEVYLLSDSTTECGASEWGQLESLLPEYRRLRSRVRQSFFLLGEERVMIQKVPAWEELRRTTAVLNENDFRTPFSFLLNFGNPLAAVNLYGQAVWAALQIADEYLELLSYKNRAVHKMMAEADASHTRAWSK